MRTAYHHRDRERQQLRPSEVHGKIEAEFTGGDRDLGLSPHLLAGRSIRIFLGYGVLHRDGALGVAGGKPTHFETDLCDS